jgi:FAD dependent oxidoreductase TIGR03364
MEQFDVAIVGAGIVGLAHACLASQAGRKVAIFERNPSASGASVRNFGMLWPIGQPPGPLREMALRSRELWLEFLSRAGLPYHATGSLHAVYRADEAEVGREFAEKAGTLGYECQFLDAKQTLARTEAIRVEGLLGALWSPTEVTVDPRLTIAGLTRYLEGQSGVSLFRNCVVQEVAARRIRIGARTYHANAVIVASGSDFETLFPDHFAASGVTRCKLQMMRTVAQPEGWQLGPALAFGLTFRHYAAFEICDSLKALKRRVAEEAPEFDRWGIHVLASETAGREVTLGDSHEYGLDVSFFDRAEINRLILDYARDYVRLPRFEIAETWHGVYAKHPSQSYLIHEPEAATRVVTVTSGIGMTMSFGLAESVLRGLGVLP